MLTMADVRRKANDFPDDKPVGELLNELLLCYKIEKGLKEAEEGQGMSLEKFNRELDAL